MHLHRRRLLAGAGAAASLGLLGAWAPASRAEDDAQAAPYTVHDLDWTDAARGRAVPVRLYRPRRADDAPVPLVVFSHGMGGSRRGYQYLGRHWASEGVASLHLQHVGSDRSVWLGGGPFATLSRLQQAASESEAIARVQDLRFALDTLLADPLGAGIDDAAVVAAGHSYGANTTLLAAGAAVERDGRLVSLREPRVRAAILMSTPPFYGEAATDRILAPVRLPTLHVTCTEDVIRIPGYWSAAEDRIAIYEALRAPRKLLAVFEGGAHSIFTDRIGPGGPLRNGEVKAATRALTTAFLRSVLAAEHEPLARWPQQHAPLLARIQGFGADA